MTIERRRVIRRGKQPLNLLLQYDSTLMRPKGFMPSGKHQIRFQIQFLFPKK